MKSKWIYYKINEEKVKEIQEKYNINSLLATILSNRGIEDEMEYPGQIKVNIIREKRVVDYAK